MTYDDDLVPAAAKWIKSSRSNGAGGNCVEVSPLPTGGMAVRDSKDPDGAVFLLPAATWLSFLGGVKSGEFDSEP